MDFQEKIERVHDEIVKAGHVHTCGVILSAYDKKLNFKPLFEIFGIDEKLPQIVSDEEFIASQSPLLFSGTPNLNRIVDRFQNGHFKTPEEHQHGTANGFAYYFTDNIERAQGYAKLRRLEHIMIAKLKDEAKVIDSDELLKIVDASTPYKKNDGEYFSVLSGFRQKKAAVLKAFREIQPAKSLLALLFDFDIISAKQQDNDIYKDFAIINRDKVIQPQNPIMARFAEKAD